MPYRDRVSEHPVIDPDAPKLVYVQVADHVEARIKAGELAPGARLPAERDLATEYGVAYDTVRRATALLRDRGLIITIVGRGTFVTPEGERLFFSPGRLTQVRKIPRPPERPNRPRPAEVR